MNRFSPGLRTIVAPIYLLLICIVPFLCGFFVALAFWALVLSLYIKESRSLGLLSGLMIIAWAVFIPSVNQLNSQIYYNLNLSIQNVNNASYDPNNRSLIENYLSAQPNDQSAKFALAQIMLLENEDRESAEIFSSLLTKLGGANSNLRLAVLNNLAILAYKKSDFRLSQKYLDDAQKIQHESFEVVYNLAQVKLSLLDTVSHRELFKQASRIDKTRLDLLERIRVGLDLKTARLLPLRAPLLPLYSRVLRKNILANPSQIAYADSKALNLIESLVPNGSITKLSYLGIAVFIIGWVALRIHREQPWHKFQMINRSCSRIWALLPAGAYLAGDNPVLGLLVLSLLFSCAILGFGQPNFFFEVVPAEFQGQIFFLGIGLCLFIITAVASLLHKSGEV